MFSEQKSQVELYVVAGSDAASHHSASGRKTLYALGPGGRADVLEYNVNAALFGDFLHFGGDVLSVVVDNVVRAEVPCLGKFRFAARSGDDAAMKQFRDLDCRHSYPA